MVSLKKVRAAVRKAERQLDAVTESGDAVAVAYRLKALKLAVADYFDVLGRELAA